MNYCNNPKDEENSELEDEEIKRISDKLTTVISKKLGLDKVQDKFPTKVWSQIDLDRVDKLQGDEKIIGFFKALLQNNTVALKSLSEGVAVGGGYLVPDEFHEELIKDLEEPNRMRSLVRVVQMSRDVMKIPKLGSRPKLRWTSENAAKSTSTADFSEKTLTCYKCAAILYASEELVEDAGTIDIVKTIIDLFSEEIAQEEDKVITQGTGVGQPTGLTTCSIASSTCVGNLDFDDIIDLIYSLPSKYRVNAKFLAANANIRELRKIKDSQQRYIWQDAVAPGQPATIYGYPVIENNWVPESEIYFGDYKRGYWLGDRRRMTVVVSNIAGTAWEKDQIGIRIVERIAGNCVLENAMRKLITIP